MDAYPINTVSHPTDELEMAIDAQARKPSVAGSIEKPVIQERVWGLAARVDPTVTYEEYTYWAKIEREIEREEEIKFRAEHGKYPLIDLIKGKLTSEGRARMKKDKEDRAMALQASIESNPAPFANEKTATGEVAAQSPDSEYVDPMKATDAEWRAAARAMRTASWGQMFFLITTDILGWSGAPFVFSSVGYGAGVALYVIFGVFATFSGWAIWKVYLELDSSRYPMMSYGDPFFRLFGKKSRHFINVAQSLQQFLTVAVLILSKTTNISQISKGRVCFSGMMAVVLAIGMISGIIRSLTKIGWLSNAAVFMNIANFLIIMVAAGSYEPLYEAAFKSTLLKEPVQAIVVFAGQPPNQYQQQVPGFASQFNAVNTMVYAYAGALLFVAFLAEMRHPMDFWKGLFCAQAFICTVYLFFGVFVYSFWGQYSINNIVNAIRPYPLQTAGNILTMLTGFIAVFMYFNIGMKTIYLEVFQQVFGFPPISTRKGKIAWYCLGPIYWILAFVVAASVPNISGIVSLVGAVFMINFTYSFPGMLILASKVQQAAQLPGEGFNPYTRVTTRLDSGMKRWTRGFKKSWKWSAPLTIYILLGLACCGMGIWAAIEGLISVFGPGGTVATAWGCPAPV